MEDLKETEMKKPTEEQLRNTMQAYINALNKKDIEGIISLFAKGGTVEDPVGSVIEEASVGLKRLVGGLPPDATFTLDTPIRTSHDCSGAAFAMTVELNLDGKHLTIHSIDVMQFDENGLITEMKAYYGQSNIAVR